MFISIIVAMAENRVIGRNNQLPWHLSADLKYFKATTLGKPVIMGRKTFESIGKPLPNRENIVITHNPAKLNMPEGVYVFSTLEEAIQKAQGKIIFIIGGATVYEQTMNLIDGIYVTQIHKNYEGDAFYPPIPANFVEKGRTSTEENGVKIDFVFLEKK